MQTPKISVTLGDSYNVPSESSPMRHGVAVPLCHISANALRQCISTAAAHTMTGPMGADGSEKIRGLELCSLGTERKQESV